MGAKFCENCGGKLDEGAKFCPSCGKALTDVGEIQAPGGGSQGVEQLNSANRQDIVQPTIQPVARRRDGDLAEMLFSFHGRLNRQRCFLRMFCIGMVLCVISFILTGVGMMIGDLSIIMVLGCMGIIVSIPSTVAQLSLMIRRFHDLGKSGWYVLTLLVPLVDIGVLLYLLFAPGTVGANEYGDDPLAY